ncbi:MAG: GNAT family N-acetyltransferase [Oscillospiraceae bacterium]|jgi:RimJ/RimL family protein N-acetyltransferase|nr:GNAT family N-acetyltransferase [Oscillospiraceae bacterium]
MKKVILKDGRELVLRPAEESDAEQLIAYMNLVGGESDFLTYGKDGCRISAEGERQFLRNQTKKSSSLFLVGFIGEELVCSANLAGESKKRIAHNCELGITVKKKYWGLGAASALLAELIRFAKENETLQVIHLDVYANNERAIHLYRKCGFQVAGRLKKYFQVGGQYYDDLVMDLYLS